MATEKRDLKAYAAVVAEPLDLVGDWENELGSVMTIASVRDGLITGNYRSTVSHDLDPAAGRLTGLIAGDTIGFVVDWRPRFTATTSWSGKLLAAPDGTPCIYALWQLSGPMRSPASWWESFLAGADTFRRLAR